MLATVAVALCRDMGTVNSLGCGWRGLTEKRGEKEKTEDLMSYWLCKFLSHAGVDLSWR